METFKNDRSEGPVAKAIEKQTAKLPSDLFLWAALASIGASAVLKIMGRNSNSLFIGEWAPSFLLFGIYNKLVKVEGHDQQDRGRNQDYSNRKDQSQPDKKSDNKNVPQKDFQPNTPY